MVIKLDGKDDTPFHLLHRLWTKAVGTPDYNKEEWRQMESCILKLEKLEPGHPASVPVAFRFPARKAKRSIQDRRLEPNELRF